jgi:hypothetical protein
MLIYNVISELTVAQLLLPILFGMGTLAIGIYIWKPRAITRVITWSGIIAIVVSLLSLVIVQGGYSGTPFRERFGWPIQFYYVTRNLESGGSPLPSDFQFIFSKFLLNSVFWFFIPSILWLSQSVKKPTAITRIYTLGNVLFFIFIPMYFSYSNARLHESTRVINQATRINSVTTTDNGYLQRAQRTIESAYPEFINFKTQKSFAGTDITSETDGTDSYIAYIVNGSGVPIIKASCFRVDRMQNVYKVGDFPDPLDSFIGYRSINPKNCRGLH